MSGYGHDESVPYAWRNVRGVFRGTNVALLATTMPKIIDITTVMLCAKNNTEHKKTHFGKTKTNKRNIKMGTLYHHY